MTFEHDLIELPKLTRIDGPTRFYELPTGERFPSVTSVLGAMGDKSGLDTWREMIGEEEAARTTARAGRRGTAVHDSLEKYVLNQPVNEMKIMPSNKVLYRQIKDELDKNLSLVRLSEGMLFSRKLKVAGSVDLVGHWKGKPAIIDFKTSYRDKKREHIQSYFMQATMYSYMLWEMTGILCPDIAIIIGVEDGREAQVFEDKAKVWLPSVFELCNEYHNTKGK